MTPKPPNSLIRHVREGRCIVFVGAGLSAGAGLPTWKKLLLDVIEEMSRELPGGDRDVDELRRLVDQGKLLEVAEHCKERLGGGFHSLLTDKLRADTAQLPETFRLLMRIPFAAWVTTNYDKLLERAYAEERRGSPRVLTHMDTESLGRLLFDGGQFVLKAHGDIDRHGTVVLTSRDYADIIHANPSFNAVFSSLLLTRALLFVGYSLSDPDFRLLMDRQFTAFKGFVPDRYALMGGLGQVEQDVLWRTARIRVLPYPDGQHGEVLNFLRLLHEATPPETQSSGPGVPVRLPAQSAAPAPASPGRPTSPPTSAPHVAAAAPAPGAAHGPSLLDSTLGASDDSARPSTEEASGTVSPFRAAHAVAGGGPVLESFSVAPSQDVPLQLSMGLQDDAFSVRLTQGASDLLAEGSVPSLVLAELGRRAAGFVSSKVLDVRKRDALRDAFRQCIPASVRRMLDEAVPGARVVLRLSSEVERFPWELLPVRDELLALRCACVRAPVGIADAAQGIPEVQRPARMFMVVPDTVKEGSDKRTAVYTGPNFGPVTRLMGKEASPERVLEELERQPYDLINLGGRVYFGPYEVSWGQGETRLGASDLRPIFSRRPPAFLMLYAPYAAFLPVGVGVANGEPISFPVSGTARIWGAVSGRDGFLQLATETGVGAFLGSFGPLGLSGGGGAFPARVYQGLVQGESIAEAVLHARQEVLKATPDDPSPLWYVLSGSGDLRLR